MGDSLLSVEAEEEVIKEKEESVEADFLRLLECFGKANMTTTTRPHCRITGKPGTYCKLVDGPDIFIWLCMPSGEAMTSKHWTCLGNISALSRKYLEEVKDGAA